MHYADPKYLSVLLFLMAVIALFYLWAFRRRMRLMDRFAEKTLVESIAPAVSIGRKIAKMATIAQVPGLVMAKSKVISRKSNSHIAPI